MPYSEEGLKATCWSEAESQEKPIPVMTPVGSVATSKRKPSYHPGLSSPIAVQSFVGASLGLHHVRQMQSYLLDETQAAAHTAIELRAVGQGGEGFAQATVRVAVEISFAAEARPAGEDSEGGDLAGAQGRIGARALFFSRAGLVKVFDL